MENYDAIIIGAGPAGLSAAAKLAGKKINALVLDRKQEIGCPKRCAEGLGLGWFRRLGLKPNKEWAVMPIYGAALYSPSGKSVVLKAKKVAGYVLERKMFEKALAIEAVKKGAKIRLKSNVKSAERRNGKVILTANELGEIRQYSAPLIIACDGIDSRIARMLGLDTTNKLPDVDSGFQYELTGIDGYDEKLLHLYFGNEIAQRGYLWIFPKRKGTANVGIGIAGYAEKTAKYYLDRFIASHPNLSKGSIIEVNSGGIPVGGFLEKMHSDNLLIAGDAAHQVDPIHGGGIGISMEAGSIAAEVAAEALKREDFSEAFLGKYTKEWYALRGNQLKKRLKGRHLLERLSDADFEYLANSITADDVLKIASGDLDKKAKFILFAKKLVKRPGLVKIMMKYL